MEWKAFAAMTALICPLLGKGLLPSKLSATVATGEVILMPMIENIEVIKTSLFILSPSCFLFEKMLAAALALPLRTCIYIDVVFLMIEMGSNFDP